MVEKYGVVFFWDEEYKGYVAEAVGLPGCFSQGKTMEEAIENIKDAIKGYLYVERKNNRLVEFPVPRNYFPGEVSVAPQRACSRAASGSHSQQWFDCR